MIMVHHLNESRSQRILWLLEELAVPYEIQFYWRDAPRMAPAELRGVHPLGKSPVITDDGRAIAESGAIVDYVVPHYGGGRLCPEAGSSDYDDYMHWLHYAEGSAALPFVMLPIANSFGKMTRPLPGAPGLQSRHRARRPLSLRARMSAGGRGGEGAGAILI